MLPSLVVKQRYMAQVKYTIELGSILARNVLYESNYIFISNFQFTENAGVEEHIKGKQ